MRLILSLLLALSGAAALVEMIYHLQLGAAVGPELSFIGVTLNVQRFDAWLGAAGVLLIGLGLFAVSRHKFMRARQDVESAFEQEVQREGRA